MYDQRRQVETPPPLSLYLICWDPRLHNKHDCWPCKPYRENERVLPFFWQLVACTKYLTWFSVVCKRYSSKVFLKNEHTVKSRLVVRFHQIEVTVSMKVCVSIFRRAKSLLKASEPGRIAHPWNTSNLGGWGKRIANPSPAWLNQWRYDPVSK